MSGSPPPYPTVSGEKRPPPPPPQQQQNETVATALYDYQPQEQGDLQLYAGARVVVLTKVNNDWWRGRDCKTGAEGLFPCSYVRVDEEGLKPQESYYQQQQQQQPQYGYGAPPVNNGYYQQPNASYSGSSQFPPYNYAQQQPPPPQEQQPQQQQQQHHMPAALHKFGSKLGNAAIFGAGATIGSDLVNKIF